jgi:hypothetical protein
MVICIGKSTIHVSTIPIFLIVVFTADLHAQEANRPVASNGTILTDTTGRQTTAPAGENTIAETHSDTVIHTDSAAAVDTIIATDTATQSPIKSSPYYGGRLPLYRGSRRGIPPLETKDTTLRTPVIKKSAPDSLPDSTSVSAGTIADSSGKTATIHSDSTIPPQGDKASVQPTPTYTLSKRGKILTAVSTSTILGGVIAFLLVKKYMGEREEAEPGIPDPPDPPGF